MYIFYRGKVKVKIRPHITIVGGYRLWVETAQADLIPESIKKFDKPVSCSTGNKSCLVFNRTCLKNKNDNNFPIIYFEVCN
jgi:hypothetical protein